MNTLMKSGRVPSLRYLMEDILGNENWFSPMTIGDNVPAVNIRENETAFEVEVAAPGYQKQDFKVDLREGVLTISAETSKQVEDEDKDFTRKEFSFSSFNRSFTLPKNIVEDDVKAKYENGLLHISLKKTPGKEPSRKQINIE